MRFWIGFGHRSHLSICRIAVEGGALVGHSERITVNASSSIASRSGDRRKKKFRSSRIPFPSIRNQAPPERPPLIDRAGQTSAPLSPDGENRLHSTKCPTWIFLVASITAAADHDHGRKRGHADRIAASGPSSTI